MATSDAHPRTASPVPGDVITRANDRYWNSDAGVNQLARELDLSKGTLYEILAPLPAGIPCPNADGELGFANRTARQRGLLSCATCGLVESESRLRDSTLAAQAATVSQQPRSPHSSPAQTHRLRTLLTATALTGLGVGLILGNILRRP